MERSCAAALLVLGGACTSPNPAYWVPAPDARTRETAPAPRDGAAPPDATDPEVATETLDDPAESPEPGPAEVRDAPAELAADEPRPADLPAEASSPAPCPEDPTLILCLPFEGAPVDQSANGLTASATEVTSVAGLDGRAGRFTARSRLEVAPHPVLDANPVTLEAWIRPSALPVGSARMGIIDYTREYALFLHPGGDLECIVVDEDGDTSLRYPAGIRVDTWTSVGCRAGSGTLGVVVGGEERRTIAIDDLDPSGDTDTLVVGGNYSASNPDPFLGDLDNVRVWRARRTRAELCAGAGPLCMPLP